MSRTACLLLLCTLALPAAAPAQDVWKDSAGRPVPQTQSRRAIDGFGGWLLVTPDADWHEKWTRPSVVGPSFREARTVARGTPVYILAFVANLPLDAGGSADVRCDFEVRRPDGQSAMRRAALDCLKGPIGGSPKATYLTAPVLSFVGEPSDPAGRWTVEVSLTENVRGTVLPLRTSFTLE